MLLLSKILWICSNLPSSLYSMSAPDYFLLLASFRFAGFFRYNSAQKVNILADIKTGVSWVPLNLSAEGLWAIFF